MGVGLSARAEKYTEEEWNEPALKEVRELGKEASGIAKYSASKTLAEKGASGFGFVTLPVLMPVYKLHGIYITEIKDRLVGT